MFRVDGLPLHPLVVHLPVVAIPLVALGIGLYLWRPAWRRVLGPVLAGLAVLAAAGAVVSVWSGEDLGEALRRGEELDRHRTMGQRTRLAAVLLALWTMALVLYERRPQRSDRGVIAAALAVGALAVGAVGAVSFTGHTGAQLAWADTLPSAEVLAASGAPVEASSPPPPTAPPAQQGAAPTVDVVLGEWALVSSVDEVPPGATTFRFRNMGTVAHALRIRTAGSGRDRLEWRSQVVAPGEESVLVADLGPGSYELDCPIEDGHGEHDALGMEALFSVRVDAPPVPAAATGREATDEQAGEAGATTVVITGFAFAPADTRIRAGAQVTWVNRDPAPHTATSAHWDTGRLAAGATSTLTLDAPGTYEYICVIHPAMTGRIVVE